MSERGPCEAFIRIMELGLALKIAPLPTHEGCWEHAVDERWFIACNGHPEPRLLRKNPSQAPLAPYHVYVEYNGWPAGIVTYHGGCIAAGTCANENTFIEALLAAKRRLEDSAHG